MTFLPIDEQQHRKPTARPRLPSLQILRAVGACAVVFHHVTLAQTSYGTGSSWLGRTGLGTLGASGVDLFFTVSGFIMLYTSSSQKGAQAAFAFFRRRVRRVLPLYWIWTTILLILWHSQLLFSHTDYRPLYILCSYLLWPIANGATFHPMLDPGWTLSFELLFYLLFTGTIVIASRLPIGVSVLVGLSVLHLIGLASPASSTLHYLLGNRLLAEFAFGVLAALIASARNPTIQSAPPWLSRTLLAAGVLSLLLTVPFGEPVAWRFLVWGLPCSSILLGTVLTRVRSVHPILLYLGDASYSIYLSHFFLVAVFATAAKHHLLPHWLPTDLSIVLASTAIIAVSSLGYFVLEKPLLHAPAAGRHKQLAAGA